MNKEKAVPGILRFGSILFFIISKGNKQNMVLRFLSIVIFNI